MYLFDFDGTLLASNQVWEDIDEVFLSTRGISPVPDAYTQFVVHHGFLESAIYTKEQFSLEESPEEIVQIWKEMGRAAYRDYLPLKEGARELLERLHSQGEKIGLLTSCMPELCQLALDRHEIRGYFAHIFTSAELGMEKRSTETYRHVAALCQARPQEIVFFDDAPAYCQGAREAGMTVIGVHDALYGHRRGEMEEICHRYLERLSDY